MFLSLVIKFNYLLKRILYAIPILIAVNIFTFFLFILISCNQKEKLFTKVPQNKSNIDFRNDLKENDKFNLVEYLYFYNGGGVTTGDINNDGLIDIYISSNQGLNKLYLNKIHSLRCYYNLPSHI